jgi:DNA ligase-1
MTEIIKPLLAASITNYEAIRYPKLASLKLDGIRCVINNGVVYSRSGKPIRSKAVQKLFGNPLLNLLDGEIIYGPPNAHNVFNVTTSAVMSEEMPVGMDETQLHLYVFDYIHSEMPFCERNTLAGNIVADYRFREYGNQVSLVVQTAVDSPEALATFEARSLADGYEGVMLRSYYGKYKHGRATEKSQDLLKVKRFAQDEATIVGMEELMHNSNEATTNELGYQARSQHKENLVGMNTLGSLLCVTKEGVPFGIGTGFDAAARKALWEQGEALFGKQVTYKHFKIGVLVAPRLPVYIGIRHEDDIS